METNDTGTQCNGLATESCEAARIAPTTTAHTQYEVQTGKGKDSYRMGTVFTCEKLANEFYDKITLKSGQKKRMMLNGKCLKRQIR
jgi:hypothetical protein